MLASLLRWPTLRSKPAAGPYHTALRSGQFAPTLPKPPAPGSLLPASETETVKLTSLPGTSTRGGGVHEIFMRQLRGGSPNVLPALPKPSAPDSVGCDFCMNAASTFST